MDSLLIAARQEISFAREIGGVALENELPREAGARRGLQGLCRASNRARDFGFLHVRVGIHHFSDDSILLGSMRLLKRSPRRVGRTLPAVFQAERTRRPPEDV